MNPAMNPASAPAAGPRRAANLRALLEGHAAGPVPELEVTGLALDSRRVRPGDVFFALPGATTSGLAHLPQALEAGAVAVVVDAGLAERPRGLDVPWLAVPGLSARLSAIAGRFYGEPSRALALVGVTGTNGKTSVSQLAGHALDRCPGHGRCGLVGTLGAGFPEALEPLGMTTPDAIGLQCALAGLREQGARSAVCEVSSHALDQHRVDGLAFDVAVFTNLTRDHLDYHGSLEAYAAAKRRLFTLPSLRSAVVNLDDPWSRSMLEAAAPGVRRLGYSLAAEPPGGTQDIACLTTRALHCTAAGLALEVDTPAGRGRLVSPLLGRFNASNLLAALGVLLELEVPLATAVAELGAAPPVPGRMECLGGGAGPRVVIDYAHTPDGLEQALESLRALAPRRLCCVFGCGGERDPGKRPLMGAIAERLADRVVVTSDNPRGESAAAIAADILAGMARPARAAVELDRARAIAAALAEAGAGDIVLIAGKGHEACQEIAGERRPFSDREEALRVLAADAA